VYSEHPFSLVVVGFAAVAVAIAESARTVAVVGLVLVLVGAFWDWFASTTILQANESHRASSPACSASLRSFWLSPTSLGGEAVEPRPDALAR
jgi:disulfide bond formation protein DsbB